MNFELKGSAHKLRTDIVLADRDTHELFTDKMRYIFIELPALTKEERMRYDESLKVYRDNLAVREFNIREGFEKGMKKGMEKGMEKGRAEERIKIAHDLKAAGVPTEIIAKTTGMTTEGIESL